MAPRTMTMGPGTLTLGETGTLQTFSAQLTNCRLVPDVQTGDNIPVLSGDEVAGERTESFTLSGTLLQDFGVVDSLSEWTYTNRGQQFPFEFVPQNAGARKITGTVTVEPTEIGGDVKTKPTADFEWRLVGAPEFDDHEEA